MYSFHLNNRYSVEFACIDYSEEKILNQLYHKIDFAKKILDRYYTDYTFSKSELLMAKKELIQAMSIENYNDFNDTIKMNLQFIYKLLAIVSYALYHDSNLVGSGD